MERRSFFKLFSGLVVSAWPTGLAASPSNRITVAGGGIVGASIAYHLAKRGAEVTLLERHRPAAGTTGKSFAWINAHFTKQPRHYHYLNRLSTHAYRQLQNELAGELPVQWGGALEWYPDPERAGQLRLQVKGHQEWGYPVHLVDEAEFSKLESNVVPGPVLAAAYSEMEGSVDPVVATEVLLEHAERAGAHVRYPCEVTGLDADWGRLRGVETSTGMVETDVLVIACGVDTPKLAELAGLEVPLVPSPGLLAHTDPQPRLLRGVVVGPGAHMKQKLSGGLVLSDQSAPPEDETHEHLRTLPRPEAFPEESLEKMHGERIQKEAARFLPQVESARIERVTLGWRPLPSDGFPVVGFADSFPGVYLAVMHSGVTLAPLIGRLATLEILDRVETDLLAPYRLSRFRNGGEKGNDTPH